MTFRNIGYRSKDAIRKQVLARKYAKTEQQLNTIIKIDELDQRIQAQPWMMSDFEESLEQAIAAAYCTNNPCAIAQHFLQRLLYRINRLKFFWYDCLQEYTNERSIYLHLCREKIETAWQQWELAQIDVLSLQLSDSKQTLLAWIERDTNSFVTQDEDYLRQEMSETGYRQLLAIASFHTLVERSTVVRTLSGVVNEVESKLTQLLLADDTNGLSQQSMLLTQMLADLRLATQPEAYFALIPHDVLACANHHLLMTDCKRLFLRRIGGLMYSKVTQPTTESSYAIAAQRLGLPIAQSYWQLRAADTSQHQMREHVVLPLAEMYPINAWELLLGYEQQKQITQRARGAIARSIRAIESNTSHPAHLNAINPLRR